MSFIMGCKFLAMLAAHVASSLGPTDNASCGCVRHRDTTVACTNVCPAAGAQPPSYHPMRVLLPLVLPVALSIALHACFSASGEATIRGYGVVVTCLEILNAAVFAFNSAVTGSGLTACP